MLKLKYKFYFNPDKTFIYEKDTKGKFFSCKPAFSSWKQDFLKTFCVITFNAIAIKDTE